MATTLLKILVSIVLAAAVFTRAASQSNCNTVIISLSPCLDYVTGNSSTPSSGCCTQFATVVRSQPQCLCQVINGGDASLGINLNQTQALALPSACKVETPPISRCTAASPSDTPSGTSGSKNVPSPGADSSATKFSTSFLVLYVSIVSYHILLLSSSSSFEYSLFWPTY